MACKKLLSYISRSSATLALAALLSGTLAGAQTLTILHSFQDDGSDAAQPIGGVVSDASGNLFGMSNAGGIYSNNGAAFEVSPSGDSWSENVILSFDGSGNARVGGWFPISGFTLDSAGNLYGTTPDGGSYVGSFCGGQTGIGCGVVFELIPNGDGTWTQKELHLFNYNGRDGVDPFATVVFDAAGNLYGTTAEGGSGNEGTVYKLSPNANGSWSEQILHAFSNNGQDGESPRGSLLIDSSGDIYGTTVWGGTYGKGTAFELLPKTGGGYAEKIIYSFGDGVTASSPTGNLIFGPTGGLYGTTNLGGGNNNCGTVFELRFSSGTWNEKTLYAFKGHTDGCNPVGGVVFDASGNLYGNTQNGGAYASLGTTFELSPGAAGAPWSENILHSFGSGKDGENPTSGLIFGLNGNLYGSTMFGGEYYQGTVFEITP
jgi:uncharacterized repeat protein (TIGR03803 family)